MATRSPARNESRIIAADTQLVGAQAESAE